MITLTATLKNGQIMLDQSLPNNLEGKRIQIFLQEIKPNQSKRRTKGSAKGKVWISPDFDKPLNEFDSYYS